MMIPIQELLSWEAPYGDKCPDHLVMLSIMKGELPEKPKHYGDPLIFYKLWALCNSCWSDTSSRPTGYQLMAHLAFINSKPSIYAFQFCQMTSSFGQVKFSLITRLFLIRWRRGAEMWMDHLAKLRFLLQVRDIVSRHFFCTQFDMFQSLLNAMPFTLRSSILTDSVHQYKPITFIVYATFFPFHCLCIAYCS